jgi:pimeloyl-ACP methyl ester carboxylesterase
MQPLAADAEAGARSVVRAGDVAVDSLGSHAATLRDLLDHLGVEQVTLVGHSLGGGIAMQFCYLFPDRVERLVLVSSGGLGRDVSPLLRSATLAGAEWVLPLLASHWLRDAPRRWRDRSHGSPAGRGPT